MSRLLLVTALLSAAFFATDRGRRTVTAAVDFAKTMVTTFELSSLRDAVVMDYHVTGHDPQVDDAFADYARANLDARGGRDLALDHWGNPYQLRDLGAGAYLLLSVGANGYEDGGCAESAAVPYDGWEEQEYRDDFAGDFEHARDEGGGSDDDVCLRFVIDRHADSLF